MDTVLKKFVRLTTGNLTIENRIYPAGSVVEVNEIKAADLIRHKHAEPHSGPAFEPSPPDGSASTKGKK